MLALGKRSGSTFDTRTLFACHIANCNRRYREMILYHLIWWQPPDQRYTTVTLCFFLATGAPDRSNLTILGGYLGAKDGIGAQKRPLRVSISACSAVCPWRCQNSIDTPQKKGQFSQMGLLRNYCSFLLRVNRGSSAAPVPYLLFQGLSPFQGAGFVRTSDWRPTDMFSIRCLSDSSLNTIWLGLPEINSTGRNAVYNPQFNTVPSLCTLHIADLITNNQHYVGHSEFFF